MSVAQLPGCVCAMRASTSASGVVAPSWMNSSHVYTRANESSFTEGSASSCQYTTIAFSCGSVSRIDRILVSCFPDWQTHTTASACSSTYLHDASLLVV